MTQPSRTNRQHDLLQRLADGARVEYAAQGYWVVAADGGRERLFSCGMEPLVRRGQVKLDAESGCYRITWAGLEALDAGADA